MARHTQIFKTDNTEEILTIGAAALTIVGFKRTSE